MLKLCLFLKIGIEFIKSYHGEVLDMCVWKCWKFFIIQSVFKYCKCIFSWDTVVEVIGLNRKGHGIICLILEVPAVLYCMQMCI